MGPEPRDAFKRWIKPSPPLRATQSPLGIPDASIPTTTAGRAAFPAGPGPEAVAAATLVVHEPKVAARPTLADVPPLAPAIPLTQDAQTALAALAVRAPRLTADRLDELAAIAAAASGDRGQSGPLVTARVLGVGHWILGRRS